MAEGAGRCCDFFYDVVCPYAFMAFSGLCELRDRTGATVRLRPILLGGVFRAIGAPDRPSDAMSPQKARHGLLDIYRWADHLGIELQVPAAHPRRTLLAMRAITAAGDDPDIRAVASRALFTAYWQHGADLSEPYVVSRALSCAGLDGERLVAAAATPEVKAALHRATDEAVAAGVFGVPTFLVDGQLFWGQDRVLFAERALQGWRPALPVELEAEASAAPFAGLELAVPLSRPRGAS